MINNIEEYILNLDLTSETGKIITSTNEFTSFYNNAHFIQETLNLLDSDNNIINKKNFFIDYQTDITKALKNLHDLLQLLQDNAEPNNEEDAGILQLTRFIGMIINQLEHGINKFNKELIGEVSSDTKKDEILITEDTVKEATQTNENTMQIMKDLINQRKTEIVDEKTAEIQRSFQELTQQKHNASQQVRQTIQQPQLKYLIASSDLQEVRFIKQCSKAELNNVLQSCGIDNARVFQLTEVPTKKKTIQKTVTIIE